MKLPASVLIAIALSLPAQAQTITEPATVNLQSVFYGDNTEFVGNPYRDGETLMGVHNKLSLVLPLGARSHLKLGVFTDQRAGGEKAFELIRPIVSLTIGDEKNQFIMGTLETPVATEQGPDRIGPHGLLPPIQVETYAFTRAFEAGMQWKHQGRVTSDLYIDWQKLNTPQHREKLNTGLVTKAAVYGPLSLGGQFQYVHQGGQLFDVGPVSDSVAGAAGAILDRESTVLRGRLTGEFYYASSRNVPARGDAATELTGHGFFMRAAYEVQGIRAYGIAWRSHDFVKQEVDPNYGQALPDGIYDSSVHTKRGHRYYETGVSRRFYPDRMVWIEPALRLHWTNGHLDYSYRIIAALNFDYVLSHRK